MTKCSDIQCTQSASLEDDTTALYERRLVEPLTYRGTVFTKDLGALPIRITSLYCRSASLYLNLCYNQLT